MRNQIALPWLFKKTKSYVIYKFFKDACEHVPIIPKILYNDIGLINLKSLEK